MNAKLTRRVTATAAAIALLAGIVPGRTITLAASDDEYSGLPESITLTGIVRDFHEQNEEGGHPDFEKKPGGGFGHYYNMVEDLLDEDGKPVFRSQGYKRKSQWKDGAGNAVMPPREYMEPLPGDSTGSMNSSTGNAVTSAESLAQWFRDVPGVNASAPLALKLVRESGSNTYVFDDKQDPTYSDLGGFFPINNKLFGNSSGDSRNYHFTFELQTKFQYEADSGQVFKFTGDDDVWVFIDDHLVIDLGGVHAAETQTINLDRLSWLEDGQTYTLSFFFAERHRTQSNFRIETSLQLKSVKAPATAGLFD